MSSRQRIRVNERSPWPERVGCLGWIIEPPDAQTARIYPWPGRGKNEVVIVLDDDPLKPGWAAASIISYDDSWTCVLDREDVDLVVDPE